MALAGVQRSASVERRVVGRRGPHRKSRWSGVDETAWERRPNENVTVLAFWVARLLGYRRRWLARWRPRSQLPSSTGAGAGFSFTRDGLSDLRGRAVPRLSHRRWRRVGDAVAFSGSERQPRRDRCVRPHARGARRIATDPSRSLLLNKPTNRERHTGGVRHRARFVRRAGADRRGCSIWRRYPTAAVAAARERLAAAATAPSAAISCCDG